MGTSIQEAEFGNTICKYLEWLLVESIPETIISNCQIETLVAIVGHQIGAAVNSQERRQICL